MYPWLVFIIIPFSLVAGGYGIVLLNRMRRKYRLDFLDSFFYFQLLLFVFGIYGILGSMGMRQVLDLFELQASQAEVIAQFIPFVGIPFIIAAWYMSLKMTFELTGKKISQTVAIAYFSICTVAFLFYGLLIRQMPALSPGGFDSLRQQIRLFFFAIELGIVVYIALHLLSYQHTEKKRSSRKMLIRFAGVFMLTTLLTAITQYFAHRHILYLLYFLVLYFAGDLPLVFLIQTHLEKNADRYQSNINTMEYLYQKYGISKRERELIREICQGSTNQQIAEKLFITLQTVKDHNHNIFRKTGVRNRVQLAQIFGGASGEKGSQESQSKQSETDAQD